MKRMNWTLALLALSAASACSSTPQPEGQEPAAETAGTEQTGGTAPEAFADTSAATSETTTPNEAAPSAMPAEPTAAEPKLPTVAAFVTYKVKDYDAWKKGFDEAQSLRKDAGITAHHLNRGAKDQNTVVVYFAATDLEKLKGFMADPAQKDAMKAAGVKGKPVIQMVTPVENHTATDPTLSAAMVSHEVKDYDAWKTMFDEDAARRTEAGLVGYSLSRDQDKPNLVTFYAQSKTREALDAFLASPELKAKMKTGGVKGKPKITLLQGVEWNEYTK